MSIQLRRFSTLIPMLMGVLAYLIIIGFSPLSPGNVGWLSSGDPFQHYIGWEFFQNSEWTSPLGLNPDYGLEISSSIVYSDSIPSMAILFKLLLALHSPPFQYFGLWLLICFVLQSIAAWQLIGLVTKDSLTRAIFIIPFIFSAPMLGRLTGITTHYALAAHFLILFALYLCLYKSHNFPRVAWLALLAGSLSAHFYLFVMVGVLWVASLLDSLRSNRISRISAIIYFTFVILVTLLLSWQLGYFIVSPQMSQIEGYGWHSFNLISPINSKGWSWLISPMKISHETNEDFNYLGIGVLACLPISMYGAYKFRLKVFRAVCKNLFLVASLACLSFFAASHHIAIGELEIHLPLSKFLETPTSLLRSSARMFWPAYYAVLILVVYFVIYILPRKLLILYAAIVFSIQILDSSVGWLHVKKNLRASEEMGSVSP